MQILLFENFQVLQLQLKLNYYLSSDREFYGLQNDTNLEDIFEVHIILEFESEVFAFFISKEKFENATFHF